jgi:hypothetical protein
LAYDNTNTGLLSRNDRKTDESHPDFTGFLDVEGVEYWLDGRIRTAGPNSKTPGRKFFGLKVRRKEQKDTDFGSGKDAASAPRTAQEPQEGTRQAAAGSGHQYDDSIPF